MLSHRIILAVQKQLLKSCLVEDGLQSAYQQYDCKSEKPRIRPHLKKYSGKYLLQLAWIILFTLSSVTFSAIADDYSERRIQAGAKLFRTLLAADRDITEKTTPDNLLQLALVYSSNQTAAKNVAHALQLRSNSSIRNIPIETKLFKSSELATAMPLAGIFITQELSKNELNTLVQYAIDNHLIIYSPFEGDVEKGVMGGLSIEARVRPYLNIKTMQAAGINLKPFFMKVAKRYE